MPPIGLGDQTLGGVLLGTTTEITAAPAAQGSQGQRERARFRSLGTFGSLFSLGEAAAPPRPTIGRPFDFRHEGGVGSSGADMLGDSAHRAASPEAPDNAITVNKTVTITSVPIADFSPADSSPGQSAASTLAVSDSGLLRPRPPTRRGNRTSLPVSIPNVASPISGSQLGSAAGQSRGREIIASFSTTGYHQFRSPPSPGMTVHRAPSVVGRIPTTTQLTTISERARIVGHAVRMSQNTVEILFWVSIAFAESNYAAATVCLAIVTHSSHDVESTNTDALHGLIISLVGLLISGAYLIYLYSQRIGERMTEEYDGSRIGKLLRMTSGQIAYWTTLGFFQLSLTSVAAAITTVSATVNDGQVPSIFSLIWLIASAALFACIGVPFALLAAYRMSNRRVLGFRSHQRQGDDEIELQPTTHRNYSMPINDTARLAQDIEASAADDAARNAAQPNISTTRGQDLPTIHTHDLAYNNLSRDIDHPDQSTTQPENVNENVDVSEIGVAYSDSPTPRRNEVSLSSMSPDIIEDMRPSSSVYNSGGSIERLSNIRQTSSPIDDSPPRLRLDSSIYSAEQMSIISLPRNVARLVVSHSAGTSGLSSDSPSASGSPVAPHTNQDGNNTQVATSSSPFIDFGGATSSASTHHNAGFAVPRKPMERSFSLATLGHRDEAPIPASVRAMPSHDAARGTAQMQTGRAGTRHRRNASIAGRSPAAPADDDDTQWWASPAAPAAPAAPASRRCAMTPIEERSEAGTRSSVADQSNRSSARLSG